MDSFGSSNDTKTINRTKTNEMMTKEEEEEKKRVEFVTGCRRERERERQMKGEKRKEEISINLSLTSTMSAGQEHLLFVSFFK